MKMQAHTSNKIPATESKFAMWRAAIALAHIDGQITNSETDLIHNYMSAFLFTDAQEKTLDNELRSAANFDSIYPQITDPRDRAHLINFARILFYIDGELANIEQQFFDEINKRHLASIDLKKALKDAHKHIAIASIKMDEELAEQKAKMSWFERALYSLTIAWDEE